MAFKAIRNVLALLSVAAVCDAANEVKVNSYTFDGSTLSGSMTVRNLAYNKVVSVIYANNAQTWGNTCRASYTSGPDSSNNEVWSFKCPIGSQGIKQFYAEYKVNGQTYYDSNGGYGSNYQVDSKTVPPPTTEPLSPGFQADVSSFLKDAVPTAKTLMLSNISPKSIAGAAAGSIIAATTPRYVYHWTRDSGLVMDVVNMMYKAGDASFEKTFWDHAAFNKKLQGLSPQGGLGEPKFYVDGRVFNDPWCRPQNDGPPLRASSFMRFAKQFLATGGDVKRVVDLYNGTSSGLIKTDMEYVMKMENDGNGCDLWEEQRGSHFLTVAVQRRALHEASDFAKSLGDAAGATKYADAARKFDSKLSGFWNNDKQVIQTTVNARLLDAAIPLGAVHGDNGDGVFAPEDERVLKSIYELENGFINEYTLNQNTRSDASGRPLSVAIGRYYGDTYDGENNSRGNPWYLCTLIVGETAFRAATAFTKAGSVTVTGLNKALFNGPTPAGLGLNVATGTYKKGSKEFTSIIEGLKAYGDIHIRRVKQHASSGNHLSEQFNRDSGKPQGVEDLTWSYGALLTTNFAREELKAVSA